jgi:hypothetical protein
MIAGPSHVPDLSFRPLTASRLLSYQGCSPALDHGPRRAQRRPGPAQPNGSALRKVRSGAAAGATSEVRARYGGRYGRPNARRGNPQRSPAIATGVPNRARVHPLESVKRLLRRQVDDTGGNLPRTWRNSISIDAGCRQFPAILPNSAGFVPGLAGNTMLPAYCSRDPSGVKARFKRVLRKEHTCRVITTAPGRQLRAAE